MYNWFIVNDSYKVDEATEGSEKKFFIEVDRVRYLVKDSSYNTRRKKSSLAPMCEYVGSRFIRELGIPCQETFQGLYKGRIVVICKNLFSKSSFKPFKDVHQSSADTDLSSKDYTYDDVAYVMSRMSKITDLDECLKSFWRMFICDAILGNRDRHEGNWGFVQEECDYSFSPIFDNGSSLFPDVDLSNWRDKEFIKERVYRIPGSQFKMWKSQYPDRPMRTNYWEVLQGAYSDNLFTQVLTEFENIDVLGVSSKILRYVSGECRYWFAVIIYCRYMCLIKKRNFNEVFKEVEDGNYAEDWLS